MQEFFSNYFVNTSGYNIVNTSVYSIVLVVTAYVIFLVLKKMKIKIDRKLIFAVIPYIILGSSLRVLRDAYILRGSLFITPFIYILIFFIAFPILLITNLIQKKTKIPYYKLMFSIGILLIIYPLYQIEYLNFLGSSYILLFLIPWLLLLKILPWSLENKLAIFAQMFDANTTFVSLYFFGYSEQHVLPNFLINLTGHIYSFVIVKFVAVISILYLIDNFSEDKQLNNFIKLIIFILGMATGLRDFLRLIFMV